MVPTKRSAMALARGACTGDLMIVSPAALRDLRLPLATWARPAEVVPGYTRAVGIVQPVAVAHHVDPAPQDVELIPVAPDAEPTTFSVLFERPGAVQNSWPGRNAAGTTLVGRIPLAAGAGTCCVVALQEPLAPGRVSGATPSAEELKRMKELAAAGTLAATVVGTLSDGGIALIDLLADPDLFSTPQAPSPGT
jgi:hypothetical protein